MNRVSVIIPCYNMGPYLHRAIQSALRQKTEDIDIEVIVVDDGSTDGSFDEGTAFPESVRVLRQKNMGVSAARNAGMGVASGEFIQFLDADDILSSGFVASQVGVLSRHPELDFAVSIGIQIKETSREMYFWPLRSAHLDTHLCYKIVAQQSSVFIRRAVLDTVDPFDTTMSSCEDHDFFVRCALSGKRFGINPDAIAVYWRHEGSLSQNDDDRGHSMNAARVCIHIDELLRARDDVPLSGRGIGFLANSVGLLTKALRVYSFDWHFAMQMVSKSAQVLQEAWDFGLPGHDPYIETCVHFLMARYLHLAKAIENPSQELLDAMRLLSHLAPDLAALDTNRLQEICRTLSFFRLNFPLSVMERTLARHPEIEIFRNWEKKA